MLATNYEVVLAKILPEYRVEDFLSGNLHLNTAKFFADLDKADSERSDPHEGADEAWQVDEVAIADTNGTWLPLPRIVGPTTLGSERSSKLNVLCLYSMTNRVGDHFDERNLSFGDQAIVILNPLEFVRRMKVAAAAVSKTLTQNAIEYVDASTYHGPMGPFRKFSLHSHQNEFRFVLGEGNGNSCRLLVGDLRDITLQIPTTALSKFWESLRA
jgi:hypothetical protein